LFEIIAAVVGVVLAAIIGVKIRAYRNLITYEITSIQHEVTIKDGRVAPYVPETGGAPTRVFSFSVKIVNRGWKHLSDVKLHAEENFEPFSVEKNASSISPATVTLGKRGNSLEVTIDFLPPKEEVTISFSSMGRWNDLHRFTGAGANYKVESIHYYTGYQGALNFVKNFVFYAMLGALGVSIIGSVTAGSIERKVQPSQGQPSLPKR
jgi:hypothetical protein